MAKMKAAVFVGTSEVKLAISVNSDANFAALLAEIDRIGVAGQALSEIWREVAGSDA
ncbi:hypothetical protein D3C83_193050 [compost metagenome]